METTLVLLTDDELVVLDGLGGLDLQKKVDSAKIRIGSRPIASHLSKEDADLIGRIVAEAKENGQLVFYRQSVKSCSTCGKKCDYPRHSRSSRTHRRGDLNYDRPILFSGTEFAKRFVTMQNYVTVGACSECVERLLPEIKKALVGLEVELPVALQTEGLPCYKKSENKRCKKCSWQGHEEELGNLRTFMGDGYYRGKCPSCGAESGLFNHTIESRDGFVMIERAAPQKAETRGI